jgi:hypothetical protein
MNQGTRGEDRLQRVYRGGGYGGSRDGRPTARAVRALDGGDRPPRGTAHPGQGADWWQPATADRWLRHRDCQIL